MAVRLYKIKQIALAAEDAGYEAVGAALLAGQAVEAGSNALTATGLSRSAITLASSALARASFSSNAVVGLSDSIVGLSDSVAFGSNTAAAALDGVAFTCNALGSLATTAASATALGAALNVALFASNLVANLALPLSVAAAGVADAASNAAVYAIGIARCNIASLSNVARLSNAVLQADALSLGTLATTGAAGIGGVLTCPSASVGGVLSAGTLSTAGLVVSSNARFRGSVMIDAGIVAPASCPTLTFTAGTAASNVGAFAWYNASNASNAYGANSNTPDAILSLDTSGNLVASGDVIATSDLLAASDARLKTDVRPIEGALAKVLALRGVTYARTDLPDRPGRHVGLLAQEVAAVLPEVVSTHPATGMLSVAYGNMVALLIEAIKELAAGA
jgi:hypothetical protein